jgi:signal transduction histidine kinase
VSRSARGRLRRRRRPGRAIGAAPRNHAQDEAFVQSLDSALEESDRLGQLIDDLLLLARTDAGHVSAHELIDASALVDELTPRLRTLANLLDNAVRHAPDGSEVTVTVRQDPGGTAITVTDAGPGIPPGERQRLTERFTQLERGRSGGGAAGLGLAIVASVVAAHGGRLEIDDGPSGRGLAVTLRLPSAASSPSGAALPSPRPHRDPDGDGAEGLAGSPT